MSDENEVRASADESGADSAPEAPRNGDSRKVNRLLVRAIWVATVAVLGFTVFLVWQVTGSARRPHVLTPAEELIEETRAKIKKSPKDPVLHNQLGELLHYTEDLDGARKEFQTAVKYQSDYGPAIRNIASMDWHAGKQDKAIASLKAYLTRVQDDAESWFTLGTFQQEKGLWADAITSFEEALKNQPGDAAAYYRLGVCLEKQGKRDEAIAQYREALRFVPDYDSAIEALTRLGVKL